MRALKQDAASENDEEMPPHEVLSDQDDDEGIGNTFPQSPARNHNNSASSFEQRQPFLPSALPATLPVAASAVGAPPLPLSSCSRSASAESLSAALASAAGDFEANPSLIAEDGPSSAVTSTREERAALHDLQEQVRQAAWATAGFRYASSSSSSTSQKKMNDASANRGGEERLEGDADEWSKLARLVEARSTYVATTQACAIGRLAALRKQAITPKVSGERLQAGYWNGLFVLLPLLKA